MRESKCECGGTSIELDGYSHCENCFGDPDKVTKPSQKESIVFPLSTFILGGIAFIAIFSGNLFAASIALVTQILFACLWKGHSTLLKNFKVENALAWQKIQQLEKQLETVQDVLDIRTAPEEPTIPWEEAKKDLS